jgi:hypothetical protein
MPTARRRPRPMPSTPWRGSRRRAQESFRRLRDRLDRS